MKVTHPWSISPAGLSAAALGLAVLITALALRPGQGTLARSASLAPAPKPVLVVAVPPVFPETLPADPAVSLPAVLLAALAGSDAASRAADLQLALRSWAETDATAALRWALDQPHLHVDLALAAVFQGAAIRPAEAIALHRRLAGEYPARAADFGGYLIAALAQVHAHEAAAAFALDADPAMDTSWLTAAYTAWARQEPARAMDSVAAITDPAKQFTAFQALVAGWAQTDPARLVAMAAGLSPGPERRFALTMGLRAWIERDPEAAANWTARAPADVDWARVLEN